MFLMKGFCKQFFDRFSRCGGLARPSFFFAIFVSGESESFDLLLGSIVSFPRIDLGPVIGYFIGPQSGVCDLEDFLYG